VFQSNKAHQGTRSHNAFAANAALPCPAEPVFIGIDEKLTVVLSKTGDLCMNRT
jgi:hypothetical protein